MSSRITFQGIAETWIAPGDGRPEPFSKAIHTIATLCDINFLGDINPTINMSDLVCDINGGNLTTFHNVSVNCSTTFLGDVNPIMSMSDLRCIVDVSSP